MNKRGQDIKGRATHVTNLKKDNTDKIESFVSEVKTDDWVWHATRGWGKVVDICQEPDGLSIRVVFNSNRDATCRYKIPEDFLNGKLSKYQHK
ncbi:MAG: hypothetical protein K6G88_03170 [Lachnospiraceae bacterium]|nr:hypothetical protein [Lachnospiraceae bacterium]